MWITMQFPLGNSFILDKVTISCIQNNVKLVFKLVFNIIVFV